MIDTIFIIIIIIISFNCGNIQYSFYAVNHIQLNKITEN